MKTTGVIIGIVDDECSKGVRIKLDAPITWGDSLYNEYESTGRKYDGWGNLELTELI